MRIATRTIVVASILCVALLAAARVEPKDQRPGLFVSGEIVEQPVDDWSFTQDVREIFVETRAWYLLPHSVTTHCVSVDGKLYVGSLYRNGGTFPDARPWNRNAVRNPQVRIKVGEKLYPVQAAVVTDPAESDAALQGMMQKYPQPWGRLLEVPEDQRPPVYFFRMESRV